MARQHLELPSMLGDHVRWAVAWIKVKDGEPYLIEKDFENDLAGAINLYTKAKEANKKMATLVCRNVGFPPPEKYRPRQEKQIIEVPGWKTVTKRFYKKKGGKYVRTKKGKKKIFKKTQEIKVIRQKRVWVEIEPMKALNDRGIYWCPYCREMRRFKKFAEFRGSSHEVLKCPICNIPHTNHHVRHWNPGLKGLPEFLEHKRLRRSNGAGKRRRRR